LNPPTGNWCRRTAGTILQVARPSSFFDACYGMRLPLAAIVILAVALPWYVAVGIKTNGDWLRGFLGDHNIGRFLEAKENHSGPIFYYAIALLMGCFPWSVFFPSAIWYLRSSMIQKEVGSRCAKHLTGRSNKDSRPRFEPRVTLPETSSNRFVDSNRFVACWAGLWFIFFSLASTKLPNYVLPMYPALALIVANYLDRWQRAPRSVQAWSFRMSCRALGAVGIVVMIGIPIAASVFLPGEEWLLVIGAVPLLGAALAYAASAKFQRFKVIRTLVITAVALAVMVTGIAPVSVGDHQDSPKIVRAARKIAGTSDVEVAAFNYFSPNLVFYAGRPVPRLSQPEDVTRFLSQHPNGFVVTRSDRISRHIEKLKGSAEVSRHRQFLRNHDLVVIGHPSTIAIRGSTMTR